MSNSLSFIDVGEPSAQRRRQNANQARSLVMIERRRRQREISDGKRPRRANPLNADLDVDSGALSPRLRMQSSRSLLSQTDYVMNSDVSAAVLRQILHSGCLSDSALVDRNIVALRDYDKPITTHMHMLINHVIHTMWPKYWPSKSESEASPLVATWWPLFVTIPTVFHVFLYAAAVHYDDLVGRTNISQSREILMHKNEAFKKLQEAVSSGHNAEAIDDSFLLAMTYLGMESDEYNRDEPAVQSYPFNPPYMVCSIQWIRHYAYAKENVHIRAATRLISLKGGLQGLSTPLAKSISINDLQLAAKYVRKPIFPFWDIPEIILASATPGVNEIPEHYQAQASCVGFETLPSLGIVSQIHSVLQMVAMISRKIEAYSEGYILGADFHTLLCEKNRVHHDVLSLPSAAELGLHNQAHDVYECCRIGCLLFTTGVLFPLPPSTGAPKRLVNMTQHLVENMGLEMCMLGGGKLLIWVLVLAGVMAQDTLARPWFLQRLKHILAMENIRSWEELRSVLTTFLWMDSACDDAAKRLYEYLSQPPYL